MKSINSVKIDLSRGFDVLRGVRVVAHFGTYAEACEYARPRHLTVRYWAVQSEED